MKIFSKFSFILTLNTLAVASSLAQSPPPAQSKMFGVYTFGGGGWGVNGGWNALEELVGKRFPTLLWYQHMDKTFDQEMGGIVDNQAALVKAGNPNGRIRNYEVGLEPITMDKKDAAGNVLPPNEQNSQVDAVIAGKFDQWYRDYFTAVKKRADRDDNIYYIRFASEMNGPWTSWSGYKNGEAAGVEKYKQMWIRVYRIARESQIDPYKTRIKFVWSPVPINYAGPWNELDKYYPGDQYVEWVGLSVYGGYKEVSAKDQITPFYQKYSSAQGKGKPMMISEAGADWKGGTYYPAQNGQPARCEYRGEPKEMKKAARAFARDIFATVKSLSNIKAIYWFNIGDPNCGQNWKFNEVDSITSVFQNQLTDPIFTENRLRY